MTKKHFQALAYALMQTRPDDDKVTFTHDHVNSRDLVMTQWERDVQAVADACKQANSAFDRGRFIEACEAESYKPAMHGR